MCHACRDESRLSLPANSEMLLSQHLPSFVDILVSKMQILYTLNYHPLADHMHRVVPHHDLPDCVSLHTEPAVQIISDGHDVDVLVAKTVVYPIPGHVDGHLVTVTTVASPSDVLLDTILVLVGPEMGFVGVGAVAAGDLSGRLLAGVCDIDNPGVGARVVELDALAPVIVGTSTRTEGNPVLPVGARVGSGRHFQ